MASSSSSPPRSSGSPNLSKVLSSSCNTDVSDDSKNQSQAVDHSNQALVGWWFVVSKDGKDPFGHIIQISVDHGRYLARSYSPWQLATAKKGTLLFEINVTNNEDDGHKKQAFYLNHKADAQNGKGIDYEPDLKPPSLPVFYLTSSAKTEEDIVARTLMNSIAANPMNATNPMLKLICSKLNINPDILTKATTHSGSGDLDGEDQAVVWIEFAVGNFKEKSRKSKNIEKKKKKKNRGNLEEESRRVPAVVERKDCFSFCLTVEEDKDQKSGDNILEGYRTVDHVILDVAESIGRGKPKKNESPGKFFPLMCSQALNQHPVLSGLTTFDKINVTASSDPLTGLYTGSNGYLVTEVIHLTCKFGQWQENGEMQEVSVIEPYDYVEAVKLTGDPDVPAGQVAFRAKVGDEYKLPPGPVLEKELGVVARYKGQGKLTGFQESSWVDVEVLILGEKYRKNGFAIGLIYSASKYHLLKLFKQLSLPSFK